MKDARWEVYGFPRIPSDQLEVTAVQNAVASRAESGHVYWELPNPRRSFVRGAVYDHRRHLVESSQRLGGMNSDMVISVNPPLLTRREDTEAKLKSFSGRWIYAGHWMHGFGHFLVETLPTLWPLIDSEVQVDGVCAHRFNSLKTFDWQFDIVALLTDHVPLVIDDEPARFDELVVGSRAYRYQTAVSPIATRVWQRISERSVANVPDLPGPPVYLSRTLFQEEERASGRTTGREFTNSTDIDAVFADHGFRVVHPETLSAVEQIRIARSAPMLAGAPGSALHLSVFAKPDSRVIELGDARTSFRPVATQQAISAVNNQPTAHISYSVNSSGGFDLRHLVSSLRQLGVDSTAGPSQID